jgi:glutamate-5-semialdehyde dehydrogenase
MTLDSCQLLAQQAARQAKQAARSLNVLPGKQRSAAVQAMANFLLEQQDEILEANTLDLEASRELAVADRLLDWLKLTPERIQNVANNLLALSEIPDPIGRVTTTGISLEQGQAYFRLMPLGVVAFVHESLPDLAALAAGLCIRTGNSLIVRGGPEVNHTNQAILKALQQAIGQVGLPADCLVHLPAAAGCTMQDILAQDQLINLVIPYGRPSWVEQVVRQCTGPVLRTAMGNCALYWSPSGSWDMVRQMILSSHSSQPDAVNAIEQVLIQADHSRATLQLLWTSLREHGFEVRGDATLAAEFPELGLATPSEWGQSYLRRVVAFQTVDNFAAAIAWINQNSSGHADCLVTESYQESQQFALGVDSASVYINASPRFYRLSRRGDAVFLGMSNQKGIRRGNIGLESLMTMKQVVQGFDPLDT